MQLNPARGRKRGHGLRGTPDGVLRVYAAQPREGTETLTASECPCSCQLRFMHLNPARGRKQIRLCIMNPWILTSVYAAQPREGTET